MVIEFNGELKMKASELIDQAYQKGFDAGVLDAWNLALLIYGASADELMEIFGSVSGWSKCSYQEAKSRVDFYKEEQTRKQMAGKIPGTDICSFTDQVCEGKNCQDCPTYCAPVTNDQLYRQIADSVKMFNPEDVRFVLAALEEGEKEVDDIE